MNAKVTLDDYTDEQKAIFDSMHQGLSRYNAQLFAGEPTKAPEYTDDEMMAYSQYREILLVTRARIAEA